MSQICGPEYRLGETADYGSDYLVAVYRKTSTDRNPIDDNASPIGRFLSSKGVINSKPPDISTELNTSCHHPMVTEKLAEQMATTPVVPEVKKTRRRRRPMKKLTNRLIHPVSGNYSLSELVICENQ